MDEREWRDPPVRKADADAEYGSTVIQLAGEDIRQVYLRVTGVLGLAVVFLTQLPFDRLDGLPLWTRWAFLAGVASAAGSAALYFLYLSKMHFARLRMAEYVRDGKARRIPEIWAYGGGKVWTEWRWAFRGGSGLAAASLLLLGLTLARLLDLTS
jgi:hypothetical protein